jgi:hypothetical protein
MLLPDFLVEMELLSSITLEEGGGVDGVSGTASL